MSLFLYNTLTRQKEAFKPYDASNIRMYVCGPTVYDRAHLGNARSVVVYDVLYRLLKHLYPKITYVRNITDVDDKINAAAKEQGITIQALTSKVTGWFHEDMDALGVLRPTIEPKATEHITDMITMISELIANNVAYVAEGHVLFDVSAVPNSPRNQEQEARSADRASLVGEAVRLNAEVSRPQQEQLNQDWYYGILSGRVQQDLDAGARVKVESYKRSPNDFVLWKPADAKDDASSVFDSPWGKGRPGWHIECSAMSTRYLGLDFDIHGGGSDLMFPHHENEIAQSIGAHPHSHFARYWVHNGFLTVNGEKMSKSLGNFTTVRDLLDKGVKGEVIRLALLSTRYNEPLDWSDKLCSDAQKVLDKLYRATSVAPQAGQVDQEVLEALTDNLNTPKAFARLQTIDSYDDLIATAQFLGFLQLSSESWFKGSGQDNSAIQSLIDARIEAKKAKNWAEADRIRAELKAQGIILEDRPDGTSDWRKE